MSLTKILWWYLGNIWEYLLQMLPCMGTALVLFLLLRPRRPRLQNRQRPPLAGY